jgi:hypothetical protein
VNRLYQDTLSGRRAQGQARFIEKKTKEGAARGSRQKGQQIVFIDSEGLTCDYILPNKIKDVGKKRNAGYKTGPEKEILAGSDHDHHQKTQYHLIPGRVYKCRIKYGIHYAGKNKN